MGQAFLHDKRLKTARYSEVKEGARQQTSAALVFYGCLHFPSVATLKKYFWTRPLWRQRRISIGQILVFLGVCMKGLENKRGVVLVLCT